MNCAILIPVLGRAHRVQPLVENIRETTPEPHEILFVCDPQDRATQDEIAKTGCRMISPGGSYAHKINAGVRATDPPFLAFFADDLVPQQGWLTAALAAMVNDVQVVGLNDMIPRPDRPEHATHFVITREAAELPCIDGKPGPMCEQYRHAGPDDELVGTAKKRGLYVYAEEACVRHDHPALGPNVGGTQMDATYDKGMACWPQDRRTLRIRRRLWLR